MFVRAKKSGPRQYLQIVENRRHGSKVRQTVIATLGRLDVLQDRGDVDSILASLGKFSRKLAVLGAHRKAQLPVVTTRRIGPPLIFGRLWKKIGLQKVLAHYLKDRQFEFDVMQAIYMTAVHRIMVSGSDRAGEKWRKRYNFGKEVEGLELHHLYRAMGWLGEELPGEEQKDATPFAPRCMKDAIEEKLFELNRDLFSSFDMVFFDTTSIYFEGEGGGLGARGNSKDHRPDLKQMVVGVVLDAKGKPVCCEMWPGNTADVKTLVPVVKRLRTRFHIRNICIVSDRGMISANNVDELESGEQGMDYILGARMRSQKEVSNEVLTRGGRYKEVYPSKRRKRDPSPLKVKEVWVQERRYIVCHNEDQAKKDRSDREAILASLKEALRKGDKSLVGNKGYRKYLTAPGKDKGFRINEEKMKEECRYDGKWVLRTNTTLAADEVAIKYKQLWMVESVFRTLKSILETRPIWHKREDTIRGHVFCSFLALVMMKALQDDLQAHNVEIEWDEFLSDLDNLEEVIVQQNGKHFILRSALLGDVGKAFQAVGVAIPPTVRQIDQSR